MSAGAHGPAAYFDAVVAADAAGSAALPRWASSGSR